VNFLFPRRSRPVNVKLLRSSRSEGRGDEGEEMASRVLRDPAGLEHHLAQGTLHLTLTRRRELAVVHKPGGLPLAVGVLMGAIQVAARRTREFESRLDVCVRKD
jgi:hypothetical protein